MAFATQVAIIERISSVLVNSAKRLGLAGFNVAIGIRLFHNVEGDRDRHVTAVVQRVQQVDALDGAAFTVVEVPAHDIVAKHFGVQ